MIVLNIVSRYIGVDPQISGTLPTELGLLSALTYMYSLKSSTYIVKVKMSMMCECVWIHQKYAKLHFHNLHNCRKVQFRFAICVHFFCRLFQNNIGGCARCCKRFTQGQSCEYGRNQFENVVTINFSWWAACKLVAACYRWLLNTLLMFPRAIYSDLKISGSLPTELGQLSALETL